MSTLDIRNQEIDRILVTNHVMVMRDKLIMIDGSGSIPVVKIMQHNVRVQLESRQEIEDMIRALEKTLEFNWIPKSEKGQ